MNLISLLAPKVLGFLGGVKVYLIVGFVSLAVGSFLGYSVASKIAYAEVLSVQHQYDDYKLSVVQEAARTTQAVVESINSKNHQIQTLTNQLNKTQNQQKQDSETIARILNNVPTSEQSSLSDSVKLYLKQLHDLQTTGTRH